LKNAPALARGKDLHLCAFNGDLDSEECFAQFLLQIDQILHLYGVSPDVVMHDLHPHYRSGGWNLSPNARRIKIQHHFGHALSVMAEHGLDEALALCFDGTGYGTDGSIWGGEFLHATRSGFTRLGSLSPFPLPGGDAAVLHPPRIAFALLGERAVGIFPGLSKQDESFLRAMISGNVNCPTTTSLGRVFDAAAAILGLVNHTSYEGEGPIKMEGKALQASAHGTVLWGERGSKDLLPFETSQVDGRLFLVDPRPLLARLAESWNKQRVEKRIPDLSFDFHQAIAEASLEGARRMRHHTGVSQIALSGGVFQNLLLRELLIPLLIKEGFKVFLNVHAPPGDGGLAVGQAWYAES
jgi:hydrogenase maturation protein HypF